MSSLSKSDFDRKLIGLIACMCEMILIKWTKNRPETDVTLLILGIAYLLTPLISDAELLINAFTAQAHRADINKYCCTESTHRKSPEHSEAAM